MVLTISCPFCFEEFDKSAIKCKFCSEFVKNVNEINTKKEKSKPLTIKNYHLDKENKNIIIKEKRKIIVEKFRKIFRI